jgi:hypothetical protein
MGLMGLFKKKVVKGIPDRAWGHLVSEHGIDVDTLSNVMRCVEREGAVGSNKTPATFMRIFNLAEAEQKGVVVTGWETFDEHPDLVIFEGCVTPGGEAILERKRT